MTAASLPSSLRLLADDDALLYNVARRAVEDALIEWRDKRLSMPFRNNGLVVKEKDGTSSDVIRFGPETAVRIALRALADHLDEVPR
jgi:hypothetical protein